MMNGNKGSVLHSQEQVPTSFIYNTETYHFCGISLISSGWHMGSHSERYFLPRNNTNAQEMEEATSWEEKASLLRNVW